MSRLTASVTASLLIAACLAVYVDNRSPADAGKLKFGEKPLSNFNVFSVDSITLTKSATESVELKRNASHRWTVHNGPTEFPVDDEKLRSFLVQLMSTQVGDRVPGGENHLEALEFPSNADLAAMGSSRKAGGRISLRDGEKNKTPFEIFSGKARTVGNGTYVKFGSEADVYLIADSLAPFYDPDYWRDKAILDADSDSVVAIDFLSVKGAPRIERVVGTKSWKQKSAAAVKQILTPRFLETTLPKVTNSLRELQFVRLIPKNSSEAPDKYKVSTLGFELSSGRYYTVTLYERPPVAPGTSMQYFASIQVRLVQGYSFGKYTSIGLASDVADFNARGASWFYVLEELAAKRFLVEQQ